jgi:uncharacterized membrane protein YdjX (TVP38/TMEM64 family)
MSPHWKKGIIILAVVVVLILVRILGIGERLGDLREWIVSLGYWGPVAFITLYIVATVAAIPGSAITVVAGALFGSVFGVLWVSIASTIGATLAFLIARYLARNIVTEWLSKNEKFQKLDRMTEEHGAIIVALTRLVPLFPFNLLNYGFGLTRVRLGTYIFWSWLCMLPGTILYVVGTDALISGLRQGRVPWALVGVFVLAVVLVGVLVRIGRKKLQEKQ